MDVSQLGTCRSVGKIAGRGETPASSLGNPRGDSSREASGSVVNRDSSISLAWKWIWAVDTPCRLFTMTPSSFFLCSRGFNVFIRERILVPWRKEKKNEVEQEM